MSSPLHSRVDDLSIRKYYIDRQQTLARLAAQEALVQQLIQKRLRRDGAVDAVIGLISLAATQSTLCMPHRLP
jgi:hypothetical protein